jgi:hypothetical protein
LRLAFLWGLGVACYRKDLGQSVPKLVLSENHAVRQNIDGQMKAWIEATIVLTSEVQI